MTGEIVVGRTLRKEGAPPTEAARLPDTLTSTKYCPGANPEIVMTTRVSEAHLRVTVEGGGNVPLRRTSISAEKEPKLVPISVTSVVSRANPLPGSIANIDGWKGISPLQCSPTKIGGRGMILMRKSLLDLR